MLSRSLRPAKTGGAVAIFWLYLGMPVFGLENLVQRCFRPYFGGMEYQGCQNEDPGIHGAWGWCSFFSTDCLGFSFGWPTNCRGPCSSINKLLATATVRKSCGNWIMASAQDRSFSAANFRGASSPHALPEARVSKHCPVMSGFMPESGLNGGKLVSRVSDYMSIGKQPIMINYVWIRTSALNMDFSGHYLDIRKMQQFGFDLRSVILI